MTSCKHRRLLLAMSFVLPGLFAGCSSSPEEELGQRMERIEQSLEGREANAMADFDNRLLQMQDDLRRLQGEVETQRHRIDELTQELEQVKQQKEADTAEPEPYY